MNEPLDLIVIGCLRTDDGEPYVPSSKMRCPICPHHVWVSDSMVDFVSTEHPDTPVEFQCIDHIDEIKNVEVTVPRWQRDELAKVGIDDEQLDRITRVLQGRQR